jgi:DNA-binding response OmpR family regulator
MPDANILLVDDNVTFRSTLAQVLEADGYVSTQAGRGDEAIEIVRGGSAGRLALLVLDLNLPDTTGVGLYRALAEEVIETPCIFMTAEASEELILRALELNPLELLRKPFEMQLFRDLVRGAIRN